MDTKKLYGIIYGLSLLYPVISLFRLANAFSDEVAVATTAGNLLDYLASLWVVWVLMVILAIHYKWKTGQNLFFYVIYVYAFVGFVLYGFFAQRMSTVYDLSTTFNDSHSFGFFASLQYLVSVGILTGLLQVGVWWFTRRWHRR